MHNLIIHIISDSLGTTGEQVAKSVVAQFEDCDFTLIRHSHVETVERLYEVLAEIKDKQEEIIIYTLIDLDVVKTLKEHCWEEEIVCFDILNPLVTMIEQQINTRPKREIGIYRRLETKISKRAEALHFFKSSDSDKLK